jgi:hypothetical protein
VYLADITDNAILLPADATGIAEGLILPHVAPEGSAGTLKGKRDAKLIPCAAATRALFLLAGSKIQRSRNLPLGSGLGLVERRKLQSSLHFRALHVRFVLHVSIMILNIKGKWAKDE